MSEQQDYFDDLFRKKLSVYEVKPNEKDWNILESRLNKQKNKRLNLYYFAIAASLLLLVWLIPLEDKKEQSISEEPVELSLINLPENSDSVPLQNETINKEYIATNQSPKQKIRPTQKILDHSCQNIEPNKEEVESQKEKENDKKDIPQDINEDVVTEKDYMENKNTTISLFKEDKYTPSFKKKGSWSLIALAGGGISNNGNSSNHPEIQYSVADNFLVSNYPSIKKLSEPIEPANINHNFPLSFGLKVRKQINNRWFIESGVVYTYLSSEFEDMHRKQKQELNYLGIPLNMSYKLVNQTNWSIYTSVGGMVEKGLRSSIYNNGTLKNQNINGLQWSIRGAIGANYQLFKHTSLFFEPEIAYFFENNQPKSIRNKQTIVFGINAGLHFSF